MPCGAVDFTAATLRTAVHIHDLFPRELLYFGNTEELLLLNVLDGANGARRRNLGEEDVEEDRNDVEVL